MADQPQTTSDWPEQALIEKVARAIVVAEGWNPDGEFEGLAGWQYREGEAVKAIQAVREYDRAAN